MRTASRACVMIGLLAAGAASAQDDAFAGRLVILPAPEGMDMFDPVPTAISPDKVAIAGWAIDRERRRDEAILWHAEAGASRLERPSDAQAEPCYPIAVSLEGERVLGRRSIDDAPNAVMWFDGNHAMTIEGSGDTPGVYASTCGDRDLVIIAGAPAGGERQRTLSTHLFEVEIKGKGENARVVATSIKPVERALHIEGMTARADTLWGQQATSTGTSSAYWMVNKLGESTFGGGPAEGVTITHAGLDEEGDRVFIGERSHETDEGVTDRRRSVMKWGEGRLTRVVYAHTTSEYEIRVNDASDDGSVIVGSWTIARPGEQRRTGAWIWTDKTGLLDANDALVEQEIDTLGYRVTSLDLVSDDGEVIVGRCERENNKDDAEKSGETMSRDAFVWERG